MREKGDQLDVSFYNVFRVKSKQVKTQKSRDNTNKLPDLQFERKNIGANKFLAHDIKLSSIMPPQPNPFKIFLQDHQQSSTSGFSYDPSNTMSQFSLKTLHPVQQQQVASSPLSDVSFADQQSFTSRKSRVSQSSRAITPQLQSSKRRFKDRSTLAQKVQQQMAQGVSPTQWHAQKSINAAALERQPFTAL